MSGGGCPRTILRTGVADTACTIAFTGTSAGIVFGCVMTDIECGTAETDGQCRRRSQLQSA